MLSLFLWNCDILKFNKGGGDLFESQIFFFYIYKIYNIYIYVCNWKIIRYFICIFWCNPILFPTMTVPIYLFIKWHKDFSNISLPTFTVFHISDKSLLNRCQVIMVWFAFLWWLVKVLYIQLLVFCMISFVNYPLLAFLDLNFICYWVVGIPHLLWILTFIKYVLKIFSFLFCYKSTYHSLILVSVFLGSIQRNYFPNPSEEAFHNVFF